MRRFQLLDSNCVSCRTRVAYWLPSLLLAAVAFCGPRTAYPQQPKDDVAVPQWTDSLGDPLPEGALLRFGTTRFHPPSGVGELALTPDEKTIVTIGSQIIVWDAATGKERWRRDAPQIDRMTGSTRYCARPMAFSSDSSRFFTTSGLDEIAIWEVATAKSELLTIHTKLDDDQRPQRSTLSLDVTSDGKAFAIGRADRVIVCDSQGNVRFRINNADKGNEARDNDDRLSFSGSYTMGRFSPDGNTLAVVTSGGPKEIHIYDASTGEQRHVIKLKEKLVRLAFSPDGKQIVATERDSAVRLYDVESATSTWSHVVPLNNPFENYTSCVAFSPDGKTIAAGATDHQIYLLDPSTGDETGRLTGTHWYPWTVAFTADSKILYSAGWDGTIRRWDVAARQQLGLPQGVHASDVVAASADGQNAAYQDDAGRIHLVNLNTRKDLHTFEVAGLRFSQLMFSPNGRYLAAGGSAEQEVHVVVWNVTTHEQFRHWNWPKGRDPHSKVEALSFTPEGDRLAAAVFRQSAAYVWELNADRQIAQLKHGEIYGLSFSPDGRTLATAGWDSIVRFWNGNTGELQREFPVETEKIGNGVIFAVAPKPGEKLDLKRRVGDLRMYAVCYAAERGLIATAHLNGEVWVWQADTMRPTMKFFLGGRFVYGALSFSPDGLWLATGSMDGSVKLWDPITGRKVWDRGRHQTYVYTVGFGRDSRSLMSGGDDDLCYQWDLRPNEPHPQPADFETLWNNLADENSLVAYRAMWAFADSGDRSIDFLVGKLQPVESLIDPTLVDEAISDEENNRRKRLKILLAAKDPKVEQTIVARRTISLLEQSGDPKATELLEKLASRDADDELGTISRNALKRRGIREP